MSSFVGSPVEQLTTESLFEIASIPLTAKTTLSPLLLIVQTAFPTMHAGKSRRFKEATKGSADFAIS
jgi:hypothetical protein